MVHYTRLKSNQLAYVATAVFVSSALLISREVCAQSQQPPVTTQQSQGFLLLPSGDANSDQAAGQAINGLIAGPMTADKAVQIALLNNMDLQARLADLDIACGDLIQAGLLKNPVFDLLYRKSDVPDTVANIEYTVAMDFLQILYLPLRKKIAESKYEQTRLEVTNDVLMLTFDVKSDYYKLAAASQKVALLQAGMDTDKAAYKAAGELHEAGNLPDLDLHRQQAKYEETKIMLAEAEAEAVTMREDLNLKMGLWGSAAASWKSPAKLPKLSKWKYSGEGMESVAVYQRLDLAAARQKLDAMAREAGLDRALGWLPELELGYNAEREAEGSWLKGGQVSFPIPLFDHGQGRNVKNRGRVLKACSEYYAMAVQVRQEVRKARARMNSARERVRYYDKIMLPLKKRIREESLLMFNAMSEDVFELLDAKREELTTQQDKIMALKDFWVAYSDLEKAMGGSLTPHPMEYNQSNQALAQAVSTVNASHGNAQ